MMEKLNSKQIEFLTEEFGITDIDYTDKEMIQNIRLKCFDIETDESSDSYVSKADFSKRGEIAVSIIDDLYDIIHKN